MTTPRKRYEFVPLVMTWPEVAETAFRKSEGWLREHIAELKDFPKPDPELGVFSRESVELWVKRRFKLPDARDDHAAAMMEAAKLGPRQRTASRHQR